MTVERGRTLSHYRLIEKIGEGGMGVVWKAEDTVLNRTVAIKVLPADVARDEERRRMFLAEAQLASSLSHAHIAQVYELGREGDLDFIVMEYVEGKPLSHILHGRPLAAEKIASLGLQVAQAVARAHHKSLLHRDLKPGNILVTPEGDAKVVDFGLATLFERRDTTLVSELEAFSATESMLQDASQGATAGAFFAGTLPYMSPEQLRGEQLDARSDIFSFGTVLYEMTTGQRRFRGATRADVAKEILASQPSPVHDLVPRVPLDLDRIIHKSLSARPGDRYQTMDDMVVDLKRLARELESGSVVSFGDLNPARSTSRTPARKILVRGGIAVIATIVLLVWVSSSRRGRELEAPSTPTEVAIHHERSEIAVLPFQNLSAEGTNAYFAGGLHDELLTQLAKVAALKVISRTSVLGYAGTTKPLKAIASELGVGSVVEGSVQVLGERLRVNVQLIDAATDEHLWAERYDRTLDDAFAIQSEVAQRIVAAVGAALTNAEHGRLTATPTANAEAYQMYLQGREYQARPSFLRQNTEIAQQLYEQALGLDPNFALAHAALSEVHGMMHWYAYDRSTARAVRQREEAEEALRLAPDLPQAHFALGMVHYWGRRDYHRALDEFAIALEGLPNDAKLWMRIGAVHRRLGNWNEVFATIEKAAQLDPRSADMFFDLAGQTYYFLRRYADAVRMYDRALSLAPDYHSAKIFKGWTYVHWQGQLDTLRAVLSRLPRDAELDYGDAPAQNAALLLLERNADGLLQELQVAHGDVFVAQDFFLPGALYAAWAHQMRGDHAAARASFTSACVRLDSALVELPDDWRIHAARGLALAGVGRRDEALREATWLQQSVLYREDHFVGLLADNRALILAQAGEADAALDEIERLLAGPSWGISVHTLRLDPRWDPIREHPRFRTLLVKYGS